MALDADSVYGRGPSRDRGTTQAGSRTQHEGEVGGLRVVPAHLCGCIACVQREQELTGLDLIAFMEIDGADHPGYLRPHFNLIERDQMALG